MEAQTAATAVPAQRVRTEVSSAVSAPALLQRRVQNESGEVVAMEGGFWRCAESGPLHGDNGREPFLRRSTEGPVRIPGRIAGDAHSPGACADGPEMVGAPARP